MFRLSGVDNKGGSEGFMLASVKHIPPISLRWLSDATHGCTSFSDGIQPLSNLPPASNAMAQCRCCPFLHFAIKMVTLSLQIQSLNHNFCGWPLVRPSIGLSLAPVCTSFIRWFSWSHFHFRDSWTLFWLVLRQKLITLVQSVGGFPSLIVRLMHKKRPPAVERPMVCYILPDHYSNPKLSIYDPMAVWWSHHCPLLAASLMHPRFCGSKPGFPGKLPTPFETWIQNWVCSVRGS